MNAQRVRIVKNMGFSLIELMVTIAIVALLSSVAVPSYKDYVARSRVVEVQSLASHFKMVWVEQKQISDDFSVVKTAPGSYITEIEVNGVNGSPANTVVVTLKADMSSINSLLNNKVITFTAVEGDEANGFSTTFTCAITPTSGGAANKATIEALVAMDCVALI